MDMMIHPPSALRTSAIATGKRCEFCHANLNTIHDWSFGTFACWECIESRQKNLSKVWNTKWTRYRHNPVKYNFVFNHPRNAVSRLYGTKYFIWAEHREVAGEKIGPVIAWEDVDAMVRNMADVSTEDECNQKMDEYLAQTLAAPTSQDYAEFTAAYVSVKEDIQRFQEQKAARKAERKRQREAEKQAKVEKKRHRNAQREQEERKSQGKSRRNTAESSNAHTENAPDEQNCAGKSSCQYICGYRC